jgi:hypothetical protein
MPAKLAARRPPAPTQQINIIGSTVHPLAFGNLQNITLATVVDGAERELTAIDAPEETKREVRSVLQQIRATSASLGTSAAAELLAAALRRALGLP